MSTAIAPTLGEPAGDALLREALDGYRRLKWWLRLPGWRRWICRDGQLIYSLHRHESSIDRVLSVLVTRERQGWPKALLFRARRLQTERQAVKALARGRLRDDAGLSLGELLPRLEQEAFRSAAPRLSRRGVWSWASTLLPESLAEVQVAARTAQVLEAFFLRPARPGPFPWMKQEADEIASVLPVSEEAVSSLWQRLDALEPSHRLHRALERAAKGRPRRGGTGGPEILVHADFWIRTARAQLGEAIRAAISGVEVEPGEVLPVVRWLSHRQHGQPWVLRAEEGLSESRAALLEFIAAWSDAQRALGDPEAWWRLEERAHRLDAVGACLGLEMGREPVRRFIRLRGSARALLPKEASVVGWVRTAWALSSAAPAGDKVRRPWRHSVAGFG